MKSIMFHVLSAHPFKNGRPNTHVTFKGLRFGRMLVSHSNQSGELALDDETNCR